MFWKKKQEDKPAEAGATVAKQAKIKKLSPKDILEAKILALQTDEAVMYQLSATFGGGLAVVTINPKYPEKGKKFALLTETLVNDKPSGKRQFLWDYNKPGDIARWILDRNGKEYEATPADTTAAAGS